MPVSPLITTDETIEPDFVRVKLTRKGHQYRGAREGSEIVVYKTEAANLVKDEMATIIQEASKRVARWETVEILAAEGTQFGVVSNEGGKLVLAVKQPHKPWPGAEAEAPQSGFNQIGEGASRYVVNV